MFIVEIDSKGTKGICMRELGESNRGRRKLIMILHDQNDDSGEYIRIKIMTLTEIEYDSRNKMIILESE